MDIKDVSSEISEVFNLLKAHKTNCPLKEIFPKAPVYYTQSDAQTHNFLSDIVLFDLELPSALSENSIVFKGTIKEVPEFLKQFICFKELLGIKSVNCNITQNIFGEIIFTGSYQDLKEIKIEISTLKLIVNNCSFFSGTITETLFPPQFDYNCCLVTKEKPIEVCVNQILGDDEYSINGDFSSTSECSIDQLFLFFNITDIDMEKILPKEINTDIFDRLTINNISIVSTRERITVFSSEMVSKVPMVLMSNKITFEPKISINVNTIGECNRLNFFAYGEINIGGSIFEIYVFPNFLELNFGLQKGSVLKISEISKLFFDIELPKLSFDKLSANMNFHFNNYEFEIRAIDVLEFQVAAKKIIIKSIFLQVIYQKKFAITLAGSFDICGVVFKISGGFFGGNNYSLSCCITENININMSNLLNDFFEDSCYLSKNFDFTISTFSFICTLQEVSNFDFDICAEFCGEDSTLKKLFKIMTRAKIISIKDKESWKYKIDISCDAEICGTQKLNCTYNYDSTSGTNKNIVLVSYNPKTPEDTVTFEEILTAIGFNDIDESWHFITKIGVSYAELKYDFVKKKFGGTIKINSGGSIEVSITFGEKIDYEIIVSTTSVISFSNIPIAGSLTEVFPIKKEEFCVKDITVYALTAPNELKKISAGVRLDFTVFGTKEKWKIYECKIDKDVEHSAIATAETQTAPKIFWIKLEKSMAVFSLHRIGLGIDDAHIMFLLDVSLNVSPLTFNLFGSGIGVDISDFDMKFYISGFGITFISDALTISGCLKKEGKIYSGLLLIKTKPFSLFAVAEYSTEGNLFAYAVLAANIGGSPAFFIEGLALGFGYNKKLLMPTIDNVVSYPLITAATGKISQSEMLSQLNNYIKDECGQRFLSFGVKFTSFEIANSFVLLAIGLGNNLEIDILGISDVTMPPQCDAPIAHAQLALKASLKVSDGFFGIEARLTSEAYIFSKDCHLSGGFAFYMWFNGKYSEDFVITVGGYHPKYDVNRPKHYPDAPRVGFNWNIGNYVNISGETYFALTPGALMAGGRLSMIYTLGNLKAYFTAKADFLISWKPFYYDAEIGIILGASYRLNLWFVTKIITVELGANMHIWGPEFSGTVNISLWIISFDIKIGANAKKGAPDLNWNEFCSSFLPKENQKKSDLSILEAENLNIAPLKIGFGNGLCGKIKKEGKEINAVEFSGVTIFVESVLPITTATLNGAELEFTPVNVVVKPMGTGGQDYKSDFNITIKDAFGESCLFTTMVICKNMPTSLWGGTGELKENIPCGFTISSIQPTITLFPQKNYISLEDLYTNGTVKIENAFVDMKPSKLPQYTDEDSIKIFSATINAPEVISNRKNLLQSLGIELTKEIILEKYAAKADDYLDEEVFIPYYE